MNLLSDNSNISSQSSFDRVLFNDKKMGAYFTDMTDALLLRNFFKFPDNEPCCCIDPSCGDGVALATVTGKSSGNRNVVNFGVELDRERYQECKNNPYVDYAIMADFMQEVRISRDVFTFGYLNPPYGESLLKERYEKIFFKRIDNYLAPGAYLCMVVPYYIFTEDPVLARLITNRYDIMTCVKFREFEKFKQIALIARKKSDNQPNLEMAKAFQDYVSNIDGMYIIPDTVPEDKRYAIPPSNPDDVKVFEGMGIDVDIVAQIPSQSHVGSMFSEATKIKDAFGTIGRPPIMPGKSHIYMLATSGFGRGIVGSEENRDKHLQRGRVIEGTESHSVTDPVTKKVVQTVRHFKKTIVTIVQAGGKVTKLESFGSKKDGKEEKVSV